MTRTLKVTAVLAGITAFASPATASEFSFGLSIGRQGHHDSQVNLGFRVGSRHVPPVAVPAVVPDRVWVPIIETRYRDVPIYDAYGQVVGYNREAYTVDAGYWRVVCRRVPPTPVHRPTAKHLVDPHRRYPAVDHHRASTRGIANTISHRQARIATRRR